MKRESPPFLRFRSRAPEGSWRTNLVVLPGAGSSALLSGRAAGDFSAVQEYFSAGVEELVRRAQAGDREAFAELVAAYQEKVYRLSYHLTGDAAEAQDLAQEVFLRAYLNIRGFRGEADFGTWLHRIAVNLWLNARRRRESRVVSLDAPVSTEEGDVAREVAAADPDPVEVVSERELQRLVRQAVKELAPEFRAVLVLREIGGYSYEEIAGLLGCSLGTVKSRLNRARRALRAKVMAAARQQGFGIRGM